MVPSAQTNDCSLTPPATLEHPKLNIWFLYPNNYKSVLKNLGDTDAWSHLDSIITHPTSARLQRVNITSRLIPMDDALYSQ